MRTACAYGNDKPCATSLVTVVPPQGSVYRCRSFPLLIDQDFSRVGTQLHQRYTDFFFVLGQGGLRRSERLENYLRRRIPGAIDCLADVLRVGGRAGDDEDLRFEPRAGHSNGIANAVLNIDDVLLGDRVDHLAVGGDHDGAGHLVHAIHVPGADLTPANRHHPARHATLDVLAGDSGPYAINRNAGHQLGFLDGFADGLRRRLEIGDDFAPYTAGPRLPYPEDPYRRRGLPLHGDFRDRGDGFRGADIQRGDEVRAHPGRRQAAGESRRTACPPNRKSTRGTGAAESGAVPEAARRSRSVTTARS